MCLAIPARVIRREGDEGWVLLGETELKASLILTPDAGVDAWVLVHAGFAIQQLTEEEAKETFDMVQQVLADPESGE
jgi:hydrogenase expression/formation protein HypC